MGGSAREGARMVVDPLGVAWKKEKKKKKPAVNAQAQKNLAAKSAAPLLQQTALSPDDKATGSGTALL